MVKPKYKILAVIAARDEEDRIKGLLKNIENFVDGAVFLDDGSKDNTKEIIKKSNLVLDVIEHPKRKSADYNVGVNLSELIGRAKKYKPEYLFLIDPDERIEKNAREKFEKEVNINKNCLGFGFKLRELWDDKNQYRYDGIWGTKMKWNIFKNAVFQTFEFKKHHNYFLPLNVVKDISHKAKKVDINIYHLKMINKQDRIIRWEKFKKLDPTNKFQSIGYDYMIDTKGLKVKKISKGREYNE